MLTQLKHIGRALVCLIALVLGACSDGPTAVPFPDPTPSGDTTPPPSVRPLAQVGAPSVVAGGDSLRYVVTWSRSEDARGAASHYELTVTDSATGAVVSAIATPDTQAVVTVPAPPLDQLGVFRLSLQAVRRARRSEAAVAYLRVARLDISPPTPTIGIDSLPVIFVGGATSCERETRTGPLLSERSDTLFFSFPYEGLPMGRYCVPAAAAVFMEGLPPWAPAGTPMPELFFAPGAPLPIYDPIRAPALGPPGYTPAPTGGG